MMRLAFEMMGEDPNIAIKQKELNLKKKLAEEKLSDDVLDKDLNITITKVAKEGN